jgi:hypothetical protein
MRWPSHSIYMLALSSIIEVFTIYWCRSFTLNYHLNILFCGGLLAFRCILYDRRWGSAMLLHVRKGSERHVRFWACGREPSVSPCPGLSYHHHLVSWCWWNRSSLYSRTHIWRSRTRAVLPALIRNPELSILARDMAPLTIDGITMNNLWDACFYCHLLLYSNIVPWFRAGPLVCSNFTFDPVSFLTYRLFRLPVPRVGSVQPTVWDSHPSNMYDQFTYLYWNANSEIPRRYVLFAISERPFGRKGYWSVFFDLHC